MQKYAAGPYLAGYVSFIKQVEKNHKHYSGTIVNRGLRFKAGEHRTSSPNSELTFTFCEDGRKNLVYNADGKQVASGIIVAGKIYSRPVDGTWKIWDEDGEKVDKCPVS